MALWGTLERIDEQLIDTPRFALARAYLREALTPGSPVNQRVMAVPEGEMRRVDLAEGVFALEQAYLSRKSADGRFEAHKEHVDLQAIVAGRECIDVAPTSTLQLTEDAFEERDVAFYANPAEATSLLLETADIAVFFPADAHKPCLALNETPEPVHKTVVKVRL